LKILQKKLMNSTQTFEEIVDEIQEQIQEKLKQAKAFQESIILNRDHLIVKQHTWIEWNIVYIRDIINKRRATASITKEDLNEYFTEAIKLKWTIDYQDSTDQIATLVSKAKTYYDWSKIIEEKLIGNYDYIPIEYKSRVIYHYELISLKPTLVEIYNPKEVDEKQ
jgi:hypothetical protein